MKKKRKRIISLLSMIVMAFVVFVVVGLMINWNIFIVIACFIPIIIIGLGIILLPSYIRKIHTDLEQKIDDKITKYGKVISKTSKS